MKKRSETYVADRSEKGVFVTLYADLRVNLDKFFLFARMSMSSFNELMPILKANLPNPECSV